MIDRIRDLNQNIGGILDQGLVDRPPSPRGTWVHIGLMSDLVPTIHDQVPPDLRGPSVDSQNSSDFLPEFLRGDQSDRIRNLRGCLEICAA